ncbi:MAG TPA: hypothetical protein DEP28_10170 [Bacteroidetes bacterium]|nr:hypothetical protein [Bacteroidota bacterium]HCN37255.1 hypothetical protein [Bacteroidota bacterium]
MKKTLFLILSLVCSISYSQEFSPDFSEYDFAITPSISYISSASIQVNPYSDNPIERNSFADLSGGFGIGLSLKKKIFTKDLFVVVSSEYSRISDNNVTQFLFNGDEAVKVKLTETVWMIPIEVGVNYNLPKMTNNLNIYLGGGAGFYFGNRTRTINNVSTETFNQDIGFNLYILSGFEYFIGNKLSAGFEMKFRDAGFNVDSRFPFSSINVNGVSYALPRNYYSRVFMDGLKVGVNLNYYIF